MAELQHYGMKGMKWGVRRTPAQLGHSKTKKRPYRRTPQKLVEKGAKLKAELASDVIGRKITRSQAIPRGQSSGELFLQKGEKVQHISGIPFHSIRSGQLYVTADESDNAMYEAYLGAKLKRAGFEPRKVVLELKTDLKAPSSKNQYKIFSNFIKENRGQVETDIKKWLSNKGKDPVVAKAKKDLYDQFINSLEHPSASQKRFYNVLKENGYNAVLDEHDITGSWMQSQRPLIVMDTLNSIGSFKVSNLDTEDFQKALEKLIRSL